MPVVALHEGILRDVPLEHISYGQDRGYGAEPAAREYSAVFLLPAPAKEAFANVCKAGRSFPGNPLYFFPR